MGLRSVYHLELSTYPLIERMHHVGIKPDLVHFRALSDRLADEVAILQDSLVAATTNATFNANSGDQVADYLFDTLGLEGFKRVSSGRFSTNDKVLEALEHEHPEYPIISTIRSYRETYKLKNTFVDRLPDFVHRYPRDGRIHTTFRTTSVVTGRLAASDPNLLAMPKHGKFAKDFRRGWVPEPGHLFAEWDLSQIELRVGAHLSQDPYMLKIYRGEIRNPDGSPIDLHAGLAQRIFGVKPQDQDKSKHRLPCKEINFGFWMGQTAQGLMVSLRKNGMLVDLDDAQRWLDEANKTYQGAQPYKDGMIAEARRNGFIRCLSGRIRYIGGIRSPHENVRAEAERFAFSTPVQEGAQWIMKQAEARLYQDILIPYWRQGRWVEPLIQIHDALTLELEDDPELAQELNAQMVANMTTLPAGFSVPIETSGDWGRNWTDMESF
jgi:DNA polymerase-1